MKRTDLSTFNNDWYRPGSTIKRGLWYFFNLTCIKNRLSLMNAPKGMVLRMFGAKIGKGVILKPGVNIKYPWNLSIGDHVWIGEGVWIDSLGRVEIGSHSCISQGALLLCGNHDYKKSTFDLKVGTITLESGCWVGAKAIVTGNVTLHSHAILTAGSVANKDLEAYKIYQGNPAVLLRDRIMEK